MHLAYEMEAAKGPSSGSKVPRSRFASSPIFPIVALRFRLALLVHQAYNSLLLAAAELSRGRRQLFLAASEALSPHPPQAARKAPALLSLLASSPAALGAAIGR